jgi:hypothetical protein
MKKKPSSIEWLVDQFKEYDFSEEDGMYLIKIPSWLLAEKEEKAKVMHKEEIVDAYTECWMNDGGNGFHKVKEAESYYNETYNNENTDTTT